MHLTRFSYIWTLWALCIRIHTYILNTGTRGGVYILYWYDGGCCPPLLYRTKHRLRMAEMVYYLIFFFFPTVTNSNIFVTMYNTHAVENYIGRYFCGVCRTLQRLSIYSYFNIIYYMPIIRVHNIIYIGKCYSGPRSHRKCIIIFFCPYGHRHIRI